MNSTIRRDTYELSDGGIAVFENFTSPEGLRSSIIHLIPKEELVDVNGLIRYLRNKTSGNLSIDYKGQ